MLFFACLLVEVDLSQKLPSLVWLDLEDAEPIGVEVEYENLPCPNYLLPGHRKTICALSTGKQSSTSITPPISPHKPPPTLPPKPAEAGILGPIPPNAHINPSLLEHSPIPEESPGTPS